MKREIFLLLISHPHPLAFSLPHPTAIIHSLTHSLIRLPSIPPSLHLGFFQSFFVIARSIFSTSLLFPLLWRWRGCEKNSWKHNEISLPFAISFGFHMVEIVSRICVCVFVKRVWKEEGWVSGRRSMRVSWWPKEYEGECVCMFGGTHVGWWMCEHVAAAITVLQTISSSFWSGSYLSISNYIHFTTRYSSVSLCVCVFVSVSVVNDFRLNCI